MISLKRVKSHKKKKRKKEENVIICSWYNYIVSKSSAQAKNILLELNQIPSSKSLKERSNEKLPILYPMLAQAI